jgi:hypothetical protein
MTERIRSVRDLVVYKKAFDTAMRIFEISKAFPKEERYSLTDQIRRSSRSVCTNLSEGWRKRRYYIVEYYGKFEKTHGFTYFLPSSIFHLPSEPGIAELFPLPSAQWSAKGCALCGLERSGRGIKIRRYIERIDNLEKLCTLCLQ